MSHFTKVKETVRWHRTDDQPASAADVKDALAGDEQAEELLATFEQLRRCGEIYTYPSDDGEVVKVTEDHI